jgi:hypothetical protein
MAEQWPFKPFVEGSIPSALTGDIMAKNQGRIFAVVILIVWVLITNVGSKSGQAVVLAAPSNSNLNNFLEGTAGISAWFQFSESINLQSNLLRNKFRYLESESTTYLLGPVAVDGYSDVWDDVKVFVHSSGYVVAYYPRSEPTSKIFDNPTLQPTRLETVLAKIASSIGVVNYQVNWYHWLYPQANRMLLVGRFRGNEGDSPFTINLPGSFKYFERSWIKIANPSFSNGTLTMDGTTLASGSGIQVGRIAASSMVTDAAHAFNLHNAYTFNGAVLAGVAIVYRQP